jgi:preprotein translocase subunit SecG
MQVLNIFHVLITIAMITFILIQKGAGATAGAAFGSGASGTVFGSRGAGNFLSRTTWVLATLYCLISLSMAVIASRAYTEPETDLGVVANTPATEETTEQAVPEIPVTVEAVESSDMPSLDTAIEQAVTEDGAGDMPVIEDPEPTPQNDGPGEEPSGDSGS